MPTHSTKKYPYFAGQDRQDGVSGGIRNNTKLVISDGGVENKFARRKTMSRTSFRI